MPKSTTMQAPPNAVVGGDRVDEPVGAELARVVDADRHAGLRARGRRRACRGRGSARPSRSTRARAAGTVEETIDGVEVVERRGRAARAGCAARRRARRRSTRARWRSASARRAPRRGRCRSASGCCRRRRRAAWRRLSGRAIRAVRGDSRAGPLSASSSPASAVAVGQPEVRVELEQRLEDEAPRASISRVRQRQPLRAVLELAEQEHVDVDRPRRVARRLPGPRPSSRSIALHASSSSSGPSSVSTRDAGVEEVGLVEDLALRARSRRPTTRR